MLRVGSDGKTFDLMFPNALDKRYYIVVGETLTLSAPNWQIRPVFDCQFSYDASFEYGKQ
jgi:hypothetical protein